MKLISRDFSLMQDGRIHIGDESIPVDTFNIESKKRNLVVVQVEGRVWYPDFQRIFSPFKLAAKEEHHDLFENLRYSFPGQEGYTFQLNRYQLTEGWDARDDDEGKRMFYRDIKLELFIDLPLKVVQP